MTSSISWSLAGLALALALAACGSRTELSPPLGGSLPVAPLGRAEPPTAEELLARPPQLSPERSLELRRRSEEREDDPFDLPPGDDGIVSPQASPEPSRRCREVMQQGSRDPRLAACDTPTPAEAG